MILPMTEIDTIRHIQKAQNSHVSAFESIFERLDRQDREKREKAKKERKRLEDKKKAAILQKQRDEAKKRAAVARAKEQERLAEESKRQSEIKRNAASKQIPSGDTSENGRPESTMEVQSGHTQVPTTTGIGATWAEVSPQQAAAYMASKTGVSAARWEAIIYAESTNNPTVVNSIGCFGYLQLHPVHGAVSQMTPQQYLDTAVSVFASQGIGAWEVTLKGMA